MKKGLTVLSLFDGGSCGQQALKELGIPVEKYFASEIEKAPIGITQHNFPDTIQLGNVENIYYIDGHIISGNGNFYAPNIDLIIGGSPCTDFSVAGKGAGMVTDDKKEITNLDQYLELKSQGFKFKGQSYLFWEYVRLMRETGAKYFFLENVRMVKKWENILSQTVGVEPVFLDSAIVSAQRRKRYYWTNITGYVEPEDYGILLKDIVHENELTFVDRDKSLAITANYQKLTDIDYFEKSRGQKVIQGVIASVIPSQKENVTTINPKKNDDTQTYQQDRVYGIDGKMTSLTAQIGGRNNVLIDSENLKINIPEATKKGYVGVGVGEGVDLIFPNSKTRRGRLMDDKCNCLAAASYDYNIVEELRKYIVPFDKTLKIIEKEVQRGKVGYFRQDSQANRVYFIHEKAVTLCGEAGGGAAKMGQYLFGCITPDRIEKRQNGQRFSDGKKFYTLTAQDQHGILIEGYIRKLTPVECERLQTLPDEYSKYGIINGKKVEISDSQRYKMLGNGWTVEAVKQFFKGLKHEFDRQGN